MSYLISYDQLFSKLSLLCWRENPTSSKHLFVKLSLNKFFANFIHLSSHFLLMLLFSLNVCEEYVEFLSFIYFLCPLPCTSHQFIMGPHTEERPTILTPRGNLEFPVSLTCMFLGCGRAQPDCCEATVLTTAPPCEEFQAMRFAFLSLFQRHPECKGVVNVAIMKQMPTNEKAHK